jgi:hypothetical protein
LSDLVNVEHNDIRLYVNEKDDSRRVKLNFSYRFSNDKVKGARSRNTATSDEEDRIGK